MALHGTLASGGRLSKPSDEEEREKLCDKLAREEGVLAVVNGTWR